MAKETESLNDNILGVQGAFIEVGPVNPDTGMCRFTYKPANSWKSLLGSLGHVKYPFEIPRRCLHDIVPPQERVGSDKIKGQMGRTWVIEWWNNCPIPFNETIQGKMQAAQTDELMIMQKQVTEMGRQHKRDIQTIRKLESEKLKRTSTQDRLRCRNDDCDKTYTQEEAKSRSYLCTCGDDIRRPGE